MKKSIPLSCSYLEQRHLLNGAPCHSGTINTLSFSTTHANCIFSADGLEPSEHVNPYFIASVIADSSSAYIQFDFSMQGVTSGSTCNTTLSSDSFALPGGICVRSASGSNTLEFPLFSATYAQFTAPGTPTTTGSFAIRTGSTTNTPVYFADAGSDIINWAGSPRYPIPAPGLNFAVQLAVTDATGAFSATAGTSTANFFKKTTGTGGPTNTDHVIVANACNDFACLDTPDQNWVLQYIRGVIFAEEFGQPLNPPINNTI